MFSESRDKMIVPLNTPLSYVFYLDLNMYGNMVNLQAYLIIFLIVLCDKKSVHFHRLCFHDIKTEY